MSPPAKAAKPPIASQVLAPFADALVEVALAGAYGARVHGDRHWQTVPDGQQLFTDALARHLTAELGGQGRDHGSGLRHATCVAWNSLARLQLAIEAERAARAIEER